MELTRILTALTEVRGPSGYESAVVARAKTLLAPLTDQIRIDAMGNLFATIPCGKENAPTLLLDAHLDEIGLMVTAEDKGFYRFRTIGGIDPRLWPGTEVTLLTEPPVPAIVACLPPHLLKKGQEDTVAEIDKLFLDTGGLSVPLGTTGVFTGSVHLMGDCVTGCGLDNRAGFAALLLMLQELEPASLSCDILICGSVQEEVGTRGIAAAAAAQSRGIQRAVVVDVTYGQCPHTKRDAFPLAGGVCINLGPDCNRNLSDAFLQLAKDKNIPHQVEVCCGMSRSNATPLQIARAGVAVALLSIPLRYMHTPAETLSLRDIEATAQLLREWVSIQ